MRRNLALVPRPPIVSAKPDRGLRPFRRFSCLSLSLVMTLVTTYACMLSICVLGQTVTLVAFEVAATRTPIPTLPPTSLPTFTPTALLSQVTQTPASPGSDQCRGIAAPTLAPHGRGDRRHCAHRNANTIRQHHASVPDRYTSGPTFRVNPDGHRHKSRPGSSEPYALKHRHRARPDQPTVPAPDLPAPTAAGAPTETLEPGRWPTFTPTGEAVSQNPTPTATATEVLSSPTIPPTETPIPLPEGWVFSGSALFRSRGAGMYSFTACY